MLAFFQTGLGRRGHAFPDKCERLGDLRRRDGGEDEFFDRGQISHSHGTAFHSRHRHDPLTPHDREANGSYPPGCSYT